MLTEATLDFPDEDIDFLRRADAAGRLARLRDGARGHRRAAHARARCCATGSRWCSSASRTSASRACSINWPGEDVAIVTPIAGTTRDTVRSQIELAGVPVTVVDTAGLRPTDDPIETLGIERAWGAVAHADLALVIVDARDSADDITAGRRGDPCRSCRQRCRASSSTTRSTSRRGVPREETARAVRRRSGPRHHVWLSARTGAGVDAAASGDARRGGRARGPGGQLSRARAPSGGARCGRWAPRRRRRRTSTTSRAAAGTLRRGIARGADRAVGDHRRVHAPTISWARSSRGSASESSAMPGRGACAGANCAEHGGAIVARTVSAIRRASWRES